MPPTSPMSGQSISGDASDALRGFVRPVPTLQPHDSAGAAAGAMSRLGLSSLPVADPQGRLIGVVHESRIRALLTRSDRTEALQEPITTLIEPAPVVLRQDATTSEAAHALALAPGSAALLVDRGGRLLGMVLWHDLLLREHVTSPSVHAGGMATPFGIHLVCRGVRAGVSSAALMLGGALLGLMIAAAYLAVGLACWGLDQALGSQLCSIWSSLDPPRGTSQAFLWLLLQGLSIALFLVILRASPITQYHGAEHQVVHALERGCSLRPEAVSQMPRVHPRCGTNLLAAVAVFSGIVSVVTALSPWSSSAIVGSLLGAAVTIRTWRRLGDALQKYVTTRRPTPLQLSRAIAAATHLQERCTAGAPGPANVVARLWLTGMPQVAVGVFVGLALPMLAVEYWSSAF